MKSFSLAIISILSVSVLAQQSYTIDPSTVSNATRAYWCQEEKTQCPLICLQTSAHSAETEQNACDPNALTYACICSNGQSPNLTEYSQTLPYFLCTEWGTQCVANCGNGNTACQADCRDNHPCGAQSPIRVNTSTITTMPATKSAQAGATTNANGGTVYTGFASGGQASATAGSGAGDNLRVPTIVSFGHGAGLTVLIGGVVLGFAVLL